MRSLHRFINRKGRIEQESRRFTDFYFDYLSVKERRERAKNDTSFDIKSLYELRKKKKC